MTIASMIHFDDSIFFVRLFAKKFVVAVRYWKILGEIPGQQLHQLLKQFEDDAFEGSASGPFARAWYLPVKAAFEAAEAKVFPGIERHHVVSELQLTLRRVCGYPSTVSDEAVARAKDFFTKFYKSLPVP